MLTFCVSYDCKIFWNPEFKVHPVIRQICLTPWDKIDMYHHPKPCQRTSILFIKASNCHIGGINCYLELPKATDFMFNSLPSQIHSRECAVRNYETSSGNFLKTQILRLPPRLFTNLVFFLIYLFTYLFFDLFTYFRRPKFFDCC